MTGGELNSYSAIFFFLSLCFLVSLAHRVLWAVALLLALQTSVHSVKSKHFNTIVSILGHKISFHLFGIFNFFHQCLIVFSIQVFHLLG